METRSVCCGLIVCIFPVDDARVHFKRSQLSKSVTFHTTFIFSHFISRHSPNSIDLQVLSDSKRETFTLHSLQRNKMHMFKICSENQDCLCAPTIPNNLVTSASLKSNQPVLSYKRKSFSRCYLPQLSWLTGAGRERQELLKLLQCRDMRRVGSAFCSAQNNHQSSYRQQY